MPGEAIIKLTTKKNGFIELSDLDILGIAENRKSPIRFKRLDQWSYDHQCPGMTDDWPRTLSPAQVARRARVGRTTVMRALATGELKGVRDNRNAWRITAEDVKAWIGQRPVSDQTLSKIAPGQPAVTPMDTSETLARLAVAEARLADALESITEARKERDAWKAQAERLANRPGLLARLLGNRGSLKSKN